MSAVRAALGRDVKIPKVTEQAFIAISKRERKLGLRAKAHEQKVQADLATLGRAKQELAADSSKFSAARRQHEQRYGYAVSGEQAWQGGDMVAFSKAIERMAQGASLATITQRIAGMSLSGGSGNGSGSGTSVEAQVVAADRKRLADEQQALDKRKRDEAEARDKAETQRTHQQQRESALGKFAEKHAAHPFLANPDEPGKADPEALSEAFGLYEKQWTEWKAGKRALKPGAKAVLDELHQREVRRLKRLGITPGATAPAARPAAAGAGKGGKPATPPARRLPEPPPSAARAPTRDETRATRIAMARKQTEQQTRGLRP